MTYNSGFNTDDADDEVYKETLEYLKAEQARDWSYDKLLEKYNHLKEVTLENLPNLWPGLEFALSVKSILNIKGCTLPFAGILLGPASSQKTLIIEIFKGSRNIFYTDSFSPRSLVSHISGKTEEQLRKSDLLPKLKNMFFLTPELAPIFSARDDDLMQLIGILTRVLDGQGYESDSGAQGHRGYDEDIMFSWVGASVDISPKVYRLLSTLGPKLYFYRLARIEETEDTYFNRRNNDFALQKNNVKTALHEYLTYFDINPDAEIQEDLIDAEKDEDGLRKIELDTNKDNDFAHKIIIRMAVVLARLRALVSTWETGNTQGSEYAYRMANPEDPTRAIQQLRNLARGHALSMGRRCITLEDIPVVIHTALSTASMERVRIFELLIQHKGVLTTDTICESLNAASPTARRTMAELKATGLVSMKTGEGQTASNITLKHEYDWFLTDNFAKLKAGKFEDLDLLKEKYPPGKEGISLVTPVFLYDNIINKKITNALPKNTPLSGGKISFRKIPEPQQQKQKQEESTPQEDHPPLIYNTGIRLGSQLILLRNQADFFLSKIHPGILDNSIKVEFVTNKTVTNPTVRFLKRQTSEHRYYYACYHCYDYSKATFGSIEEYDRHIVNNHKPATVGYPGYPDREKIELERVRRKQEHVPGSLGG